MFCHKIEEQFFSGAELPSDDSEKETALFNNISDDEVDQLFAF